MSSTRTGSALMPQPNVVTIRRGAAGGVVARRAIVATHLAERAWGLLGRSTMATDEAMIFPGCNSVHTWFMRIPIDIVFLQGGAVVKIASKVAPFHMVWAREADTVVELRAGQAQASGIATGATLQWD